MPIPKAHAANSPESAIDFDIAAFLIDRQASGLAAGSVRFYRQKLNLALAYLMGQGIDDVAAVTPAHLREMLIWLSEAHNPGGIRGVYRALCMFFKWYGRECAPDGWRNPAEYVKSPKVPELILEPVSFDAVRAMLAACQGRKRNALRDRAIILCLMDSGMRAHEFAMLDVSDVNVQSGAVLVRYGKGRKARAVYFGMKARRALMAYLRLRGNLPDDAPLFATDEGGRFAYHGLRDIIRRRAADAGIIAPTLHSFRRGFALESLRNGADIYSLQRLMGHADLTMMRRYLKQSESDLAATHQSTSPVDRWRL